MRQRIRYIPFFLLSVSFVLICSCSTFPTDFFFLSSKAWISPSQSDQPSLYLADVLVDKASGWTSIEQETRNILPLLFSDYDYPFTLNQSNADYIVDVQAIEREYLSGWRTKRSIAIEIQIYQNNILDEYHNKPPIIVAKTTSSSNVSLASSKVLHNLLVSGVRKVVRSFKTLQKKQQIR
jgi:hypothetical protein